MGATEEMREEDLFDGECLKLMNEYFYGVRIFPGQDPAHVYIGWVTTQYHIHDTAFDQSKVRSVIVQEYTEEGHIQNAWVYSPALDRSLNLTETCCIDNRILA